MTRKQPNSELLDIRKPLNWNLTSGSSRSFKLRPDSEFNKSLTFSLYISSPDIFIVKSLSGDCNDAN